MLDEVDRVLDGQHFLGRVVRNLAPEFFLKSHYELDDVETVGAKIIDEVGALQPDPSPLMILQGGA